MREFATKRVCMLLQKHFLIVGCKVNAYWFAKLVFRFPTMIHGQIWNDELDVIGSDEVVKPRGCLSNVMD